MKGNMLDRGSDVEDGMQCDIEVGATSLLGCTFSERKPWSVARTERGLRRG